MDETMAATETPETPETTGHVTGGIERLEALAQELDSATTRLGKRLAPILCESLPSPDSNVKEVRTVASPLSERIDGVADRIAGHVVRITDLRERLDA